jgi:hypothetical protein
MSVIKAYKNVCPHIDISVVKMGRGVSVVKRCSAFLTQRSTVLVVQGLTVAQNKAERLALNWTHRTNIINMHDSLSWLRVEE